ncbi:hypothetical protein [Acanthopleuribacter pedis]|uniref:Uncharacterized protein n=1 Tax=Acanthopleuribacter pedis TaxID=442870 RepID=A0A8J7U6Y8_9BACT|nr:hypothetical protein [Acanthopleuribacter pedis]MBO1321928.1 hypothetical protein [Acanthopleuribacter pedis]
MKLLSTVCLMTLSLSALAGSGQAYLNHFYSATHSARTANQVDGVIYITNISSDPVIVTVTLYNDQGVIISDGDDLAAAGKLKATNAANYSDSSAYFSMKFTLAPNATSQVWVDNPSTAIDYGHGLISWWNEGPEPETALIAHGVMYRSYSGNVGYYSVQVNEGKPF